MPASTAARLAPTVALRPNERISLDYKLEDLHYFDGENGARIEAR